MRGLSGFLFLLAALACVDAYAARPKKKKRNPGPVVMKIQPGTAKPGDVVSVTLLHAGAVPEGTLGTTPLRFHPWKKGYRAIAPLSVDQKLGTLDVRVLQAPHPPPAKKRSKRPPPARPPKEFGGTVEIVDPKFPRRELRVAKKFIQPPPSVKRQIIADRKAFKQAYDQKDSPPLFTQRFGWPRPNYVTAPFGDLRTYNGRKQSQHYGVDLEGRVGEPILSANDGVVVLSRDAYASGKTVLVHHGARLFTAYFHLSAIGVKEGQKVKKGQLLGKVGSTGRVTGPHLHFAVKLDGMYIDPLALLRLSL